MRASREVGRGRKKNRNVPYSFNIPAWTTLIMKFILFKTDKMGLVSFSDAVEVIGEVRSSILLENHEYRLGIRFAEIKQQDKSEIGSFVESTLRP